MAFDFKKQLEIGKQGQQIFLSGYHETLLPLTGRNTDFRIESGPNAGKLLELKSDQYAHDATANFFLERWSVHEKKAPGGPWQSLLKGCHVFVYLYAADGIYYQFEDLQALIARVQDRMPQSKLIRIPNKGYTTTGWKVPRSMLEDLYTVHRLTAHEAAPKVITRKKKSSSGP